MTPKPVRMLTSARSRSVSVRRADKMAPVSAPTAIRELNML